MLGMVAVATGAVLNATSSVAATPTVPVPPAPAIVAPLPPDPVGVARERTTAWIVPWDRANVMASLRAHQGSLGRISPFWFVLRADARAVADRAGSMDSEVLSIAAANGMVVLPTVNNEFDPRRLTRMLQTATSRSRHVRQLVAIAARPGFDGIDLDYENVAPRDRARFASFVGELAAALHARDRQLSVTVMASTRFGSSRHDLATDYRSIGEDADEVRVMAYDYHWACGSVGPIAPIEWVEDVVTYVSSLVPSDKLVLGVPLYGYDWPRRGCAKARTWQQTQGVRRRVGGMVQWAARWQTNSLRYGRSPRARVVWFEDAAASAAKARIAAEHGLRGIALWRTGGEDPATWPALTAVLGEPVD